MGYAEQQQLSVDGEFQNRVWAALCNEAAYQAEPDAVATAILADPWEMVGRFMPLIATAPGFGDRYAEGGQAAITDAELLSAVQGAWPRVVLPLAFVTAKAVTVS